MHSGYLNQNFDRKKQDDALRRIKKTLKDNDVQFDGFVVRGLSGMLMGSIAARSLRKDLVVIRKPGDSSNCYFEVENYRPSKKYIFLDDLIASGSTQRAVKESIFKIHEARRARKYTGYTKNTQSKIIGYILYNANNIKFTKQ